MRCASLSLLSSLILGSCVIDEPEDEFEPRRDIGDYAPVPPDEPFDPGWTVPGEVCWVFDMSGPATASFANAAGHSYVKEVSDLASIDGLESYSYAMLLVTATDTGVFSLSAPAADAPDISLFVSNPGGEFHYYEPTSGTVTVAGTLQDGTASFGFANLELQEDVSGRAEPARCFSFLNFSIDGVVQVPAGWSCSDAAYADGICHCGCGVIDPACAKTTCEQCQALGTCAPPKTGCDWIDPADSSSCAEPPDDPNPKQVTVWADVLTVFDNNCANCHSDDPETDEQLPPPIRDPQTAVSFTVPGSPAQSVLWQVIENNTMPPGGGLSNAAELVIEDWIADGALLN